MPLYEYQCKQCGNRFEKIQSFSAPDEKECPKCGAEVERLISAPAIQFKGAGWYVNDYAGRNKAPSSSGSESSKEGAKDGGSKESGGKDVAAKSSEGSPAKAIAAGVTAARVTVAAKTTPALPPRVREATPRVPVPDRALGLLISWRTSSKKISCGRMTSSAM